LLEEPETGQWSCEVSGFLRARLGVDLTRTIANDAQLAGALVTELDRRGLHSLKLEKEDYGSRCRPLRPPGPASKASSGDDRRDPSHIAIVSEWDTLYGRSLRRVFKADKDVKGFCVDRFAYMRGLDGLLPDQGPSGDGDGAEKKSTSALGGDRRKDGTFIERPEGQSQFDYLRRLAKQMLERDAQLRRLTPDGQGLQAIGVLGNDVHDKLLVLQALQPEFPTAIFFTTDLDARFLHPRERAWTRNLVVASSFGTAIHGRPA